MVNPVTGKGELTRAEEDLLHLVAEGRTIKAIAVAQGITPSAAADAVEKLFLRMAADASSGGQNSLRRLRSLYEAIVNREEQGESLSRLLPSGVAEMMREQGRNPGETEGAGRQRSHVRHPRVLRPSPRKPTRACSPGN